MDAINTKQCSKCREYLPYTSFYKTRGTLVSACKPCTIEYQVEYRRKKSSPNSRSQRPLFLINRERLALGGTYRARYTTTHRPMALEMLPYGYILDEVLVYGTYDIEDILLYLHDRKVKVIEKEAENCTEVIAAVRNSCGNPIDVEVLIGLVSLDQYYLWMDDPRPMTPAEVSNLCHLSLDTVNFVLQKKGYMVPMRPHSPGREISEHKTPQVVDITIKEDTDDIIFVEE